MIDTWLGFANNAVNVDEHRVKTGIPSPGKLARTIICCLDIVSDVSELLLSLNYG